MRNMSPMQLISLVKNRNPEQFALEMVKNSQINDPTINQLISSAQNGDNEQVTKIAEDFFNKRGLNFSQEFNSFMSMLQQK